MALGSWFGWGPPDNSEEERRRAQEAAQRQEMLDRYLMRTREAPQAPPVPRIEQIPADAQVSMPVQPLDLGAPIDYARPEVDTGAPPIQQSNIRPSTRTVESEVSPVYDPFSTVARAERARDYPYANQSLLSGPSARSSFRPGEMVEPITGLRVGAAIEPVVGLAQRGLNIVRPALAAAAASAPAQAGVQAAGITGQAIEEATQPLRDYLGIDPYGFSDPAQVRMQKAIEEGVTRSAAEDQSGGFRLPAPVENILNKTQAGARHLATAPLAELLLDPNEASAQVVRQLPGGEFLQNALWAAYAYAGIDPADTPALADSLYPVLGGLNRNFNPINLRTGRDARVRDKTSLDVNNNLLSTGEIDFMGVPMKITYPTIFNPSAWQDAVNYANDQIRRKDLINKEIEAIPEGPERDAMEMVRFFAIGDADRYEEAHRRASQAIAAGEVPDWFGMSRELDQPGAALVSDTVLDWTNLLDLPGSAAVKAARVGRATAAVEKASLTNIDEGMDAAVKLLQNVDSGINGASYKKRLAGAENTFRWFGEASWLGGRSAESQAEIDTSSLLQMVRHIFGNQIDTKVDARQVIDALVNNPRKLVEEGLDLVGPNVTRTLRGGDGMMRWGVGVSTIGSEKYTKLFGILQFAKDELLRLKSLDGDGPINLFEFANELVDTLHLASRRNQGLAGGLKLPLGADRARIANRPGNKAVVEYVSGTGKNERVLRTSKAMTIEAARAEAKRATRIITGGKTALERGMQGIDAVVGAQKMFMNVAWLGLRPANWLSNALSAAIMTYGNDVLTMAPNSAAIEMLMKKSGGNARFLEEAKLLEKGFSTKNPVQAFAQGPLSIPYGTTELLGQIPFGEGAFHLRAYATAFGRDYAEVWTDVTQKYLLKNLIDGGMPPELARSLANTVRDVGIAENPQEALRVIERALDSGTLPPSLTPYGIDPSDETLTLPGASKLIGVTRSYTLDRLPEAEAAAKAIFDAERARFSALLAAGGPNLGPRKWTKAVTLQDKLNAAGDMMKSAKAAGLPDDQVKALAKETEAILQKEVDLWESMRADLASSPDPDAMAAIADFHRRTVELKNEARNSVDRAQRAAGAATRAGDPNASALWVAAIQSKKNAWARYGDQMDRLGVQYRQVLSDIRNGSPYTGGTAWNDMVKRYFGRTAEELDAARRIVPGITDPDVEAAYDVVKEASREIVDRKFVELADAFRLFPTPENLDLVIHAHKFVDEWGAAIASELRKSKAVGDAKKLELSAEWNKYVDDVSEYIDEIRPIMVAQGLGAAAQSGLSWKVGTDTFRLIGPGDAGKWRVWSASTKRLVEIGESAVPANVLSDYANIVADGPAAYNKAMALLKAPKRTGTPLPTPGPLFPKRSTLENKTFVYLRGKYDAELLRNGVTQAELDAITKKKDYIDLMERVAAPPVTATPPAAAAYPPSALPSGVQVLGTPSIATASQVNRSWKGNKLQQQIRQAVNAVGGQGNPTPADIAGVMLERVDQMERKFMAALPDILRGTPDGMTPAARQKAMDILRRFVTDHGARTLEHAEDMGQRVSNWAMLNFGDRTRIETFFNYFVPYSYYWSHMPTRAALLALQKPGLVNFFYDLDRNSRLDEEQQKARTGYPYPRRVEGTNLVAEDADWEYRFNTGRFVLRTMPGVMYFDPGFYVDAGDNPTDAEKVWNQIQQYAPGLYPAQQYVLNEILDYYTPKKENGQVVRRNAEFDFSDLFPQGRVAIQFLVSNPKSPFYGAAWWLAEDKWNPYRARRAVSTLTQELFEKQGYLTDEQLNIALSAEQIIANYEQGESPGFWLPDRGTFARKGARPPLEGIQPQYVEPAQLLMTQAIARAAGERLTGTGSSLIGAPISPYPKSEGELALAQQEFFAAGYNPATGLGSREAQVGEDGVLEQQPALAVKFGVGESLPAADPESQASRVKSNLLFAKLDDITKRRNAEVDALINRIRSEEGREPTDDELDVVRDPYRKETDAAYDLYGYNASARSYAGMNPREHAQALIEQVLKKEYPGKPEYPEGLDDLPKEERQAYYEAKAAWDIRQRAHIESFLDTLAMELDPLPPDVQANLRLMLMGEYASDLMRRYDNRFVSDLEYEWNEQRVLKNELTAEQWKERENNVRRTMGNEAVVLFNQYGDAETKEEKDALKASDWRYAAANIAAYNPLEYTYAVMNWGPEWYRIIHEAPKSPGEYTEDGEYIEGSATPAEEQAYFDALAAHKMANPNYEQMKLWLNGRRNAGDAGLMRESSETGEEPFKERDFGEDMAELLSMWPDTFKNENLYVQGMARYYASKGGDKNGHDPAQGPWNTLPNWDEVNMNHTAYKKWKEEYAKERRVLPPLPEEPVPPYETYAGERPVGSGAQPVLPGGPQAQPPSFVRDQPVQRGEDLPPVAMGYGIPYPITTAAPTTTGAPSPGFSTPTTGTPPPGQPAPATGAPPPGVPPSTTGSPPSMLEYALRDPKFAEGYAKDQAYGAYWEEVTRRWGPDAQAIVQGYDADWSREQKNAYFDQYPWLEEAWDLREEFGLNDLSGAKGKESAATAALWKQAEEMWPGIRKIVNGYDSSWSREQKNAYFAKYPQILEYWDWRYGPREFAQGGGRAYYGGGYGGGGGGYSSGGYDPNAEYFGGDINISPRYIDPSTLPEARDIRAWRPYNIEATPDWMRAGDLLRYQPMRSGWEGWGR